MEEKLYSKEQVANMMTNAMDGYDKGYDKGRVRGKVDGIIQSLAMTAVTWFGIKVYQAYVKKTQEAQNEEEAVDADFEEV